MCLNLLRTTLLWIIGYYKKCINGLLNNDSMKDKSFSIIYSVNTNGVPYVITTNKLMMPDIFTYDLHMIWQLSCNKFLYNYWYCFSMLMSCIHSVKYIANEFICLQRAMPPWPTSCILIAAWRLISGGGCMRTGCNCFRTGSPTDTFWPQLWAGIRLSPLWPCWPVLVLQYQLLLCVDWAWWGFSSRLPNYLLFPHGIM